jgi:hypothetical protein
MIVTTACVALVIVTVTGVVEDAESVVEPSLIVDVIEQVPLEAVIVTTPVDELTEHPLELPAE